MRLFIFSLLINSLIWVEIHGHGRLIKPAARNAMWRYGFANPVNYNDNEVWCGGVGDQHGKYEGKCGVCGDSFGDEQPREHENGGKYGQGVLAHRYVMGQTIDVHVDLTTNHWGYFEFSLCDDVRKNKPATEECFEKNVLFLTERPGETRYYIAEDTPKKMMVKYKLDLPQGVSCTNCVLRWTYVTGNTWGKCEDGTEKVGCGDQETFRNCADIQIYSVTQIPPHAAANVDIPNAIFYTSAKDGGEPEPLVIKADVCVPTKLFRKMPKMAEWCQRNCLKFPPNCPSSMCTCLGECKAIGRLADIEGTDVYCHRNCLRYPSNCPETECSCSEITVLGEEVQQSGQEGGDKVVDA